MDVSRRLRPVYAGRRVMLVCGPVQSKTDVVAELRSMGVDDCLVIGSQGVGPAPAAESVIVPMQASSLMDEFRRWERLAVSPPPEVAAAVDRFAPDLVMANGVESMASFAGRPVFGGRRPQWTALEDKTTVDGLWDDAAVPRAPAETVALDPAAAWAAHERLDAGAGTVWSGDSRDGWHGGGALVRRVRSADEGTRVLGELAAHCDRARVVPFLDGLPCSIHGFVTPAGVAAFRPVEMVVLRAPDGFRYCGTATTWDPAPEDREAMREVVRRVGALLRARVGFRGFFTVDGVMTVDGFRPTELNPRVGAGLRYVSSAVPSVPVGLLQFAAVEGVDDVDADELERVVVDGGDRVRVRACQAIVAGRELTGAETIESGDATLELGPSSIGAFLRITTTDLPADGEPFAPTAARLLALADRTWSLGMGPLEPAPNLR
jgi:hypothetical protein